jgi:uncharacterized membrane protein YfcA
MSCGQGGIYTFACPPGCAYLVSFAVLSVFLAVVLVGSYVQAVAGFAMGMLIIAVVTVGGLFDLVTITAVVSLLSFANITLSLHGHYHLVHGGVLRGLVVGQLPAVLAGFWLLQRMNDSALSALELMLGLFIVAGSLSMMLRPAPRATVSGHFQCLLAGLGGGLLSGLFAASGPVIGWFTYRQPLPVTEIRATLLGFFAITTVFRTALVGLGSGFTSDVLLLAAIGLPAVFVGAGVGRRWPPAVGERGMRRLAFGLLLAMGTWIIGSVALGS